MMVLFLAASVSCLPRFHIQSHAAEAAKGGGGDKDRILLAEHCGSFLCWGEGK